MKRRSFLTGSASVIATGIAVAGTIGVVRGIRYPTVQYEPDWASSSFDINPDVQANTSGAVRKLSAENVFQLQATSMQPAVDLVTDKGADVHLRIDNVHPDAILDTNLSTLSEERTGLQRTITGRIPGGSEIQLRWRFAKQAFRIGIIGDTGGGEELKWCLGRASSLGADFMLHLGDIYYQPSDVGTVPGIMAQSACPVFTAIGNHDFHKGFNKLHVPFTNTVGPRNNSFLLGGIRFFSIDTAAATLPVSRGERASLLDATIAEARSTTPAAQVVCYTHKPLTDPRHAKNPEHDHTVTDREKDWIREQLKAAGTSHLLAGHIHLSAELDEQGIKTWVAGEGMAHRDIVSGRKIAKLLMADVADRQIDFAWQPLLMPDSAHCNERILKILNSVDFKNRSVKLSDFCPTAAS